MFLVIGFVVVVIVFVVCVVVMMVEVWVFVGLCVCVFYYGGFEVMMIWCEVVFIFGVCEGVVW